VSGELLVAPDHLTRCTRVGSCTHARTGSPNGVSVDQGAGTCCCVGVFFASCEFVNRVPASNPALKTTLLITYFIIYSYLQTCATLNINRK
jgi:hypothetical protein